MNIYETLNEHQSPCRGIITTVFQMINREEKEMHVSIFKRRIHSDQLTFYVEQTMMKERERYKH